MIKELLFKIFNITDFSVSYQAMVDKYRMLDTEYEMFKERYHELSVMAADPIKYIDEHASKLDEQYTKCAEVCEEIVREANDRIERLDRDIHKAYAQGRADAYAEMGIKNIEAHEMGGFLAIMPDGEVVPLLSLEDFTEIRAEELRPHIDYADNVPNEIEIGDLV